MYQGVFLIQSSCFPYKFTDIDDDSEYDKNLKTLFFNMNMFYLLAASEQNNDVRFWLFLTPYLSVTEFVLSVHEPCAKRSLNW